VKFISTLIALLLISLVLQAKAPAFKSASILGQISESTIDEASGLGISRKNLGIIYTHNDGSQGKVFALNLKGDLIAILNLPPDIIKTNSDFEDIAVGVGPENGISYIYFGDFGDNNALRTNKSVIRFPEPIIDANKPQENLTISNIDVINFKFDDGLRDCETLMIDPWTKDIILVSKRETFVAAYTLSNEEIPSDNEYTAKKISTLKFGKGSFAGSGVTGGDISSDGKEILIRDYGNMYYFSREIGEDLGSVLSKDPDKIPQYNLFPNIEPQGEAVAWDSDASSFYTTSETKAGIKSSITQFKKETTEILNQKKSTNPIEIIGNKLQINQTDLVGFGRLEIYNSLSRLLENYHISEKNVVISLEKLETGTYFVRYICGETPFFEKFNIVK